MFAPARKAKVMPRPDSHIWEAMLAHLRQHHPDMTRHWFEDIEAYDLAGGTLRLLVRVDVHRNYLQRACIIQFREAAQAATGYLVGIEFIGEADIAQAKFGGGHKKAGGGRKNDALLGPDAETLLLPDYCFANFVIGTENRMAHAGAIAVSKGPGKAYNPFFIHSGVGLGKTHLLQAICQATMADNPSRQICYISCESFVSRFHEALQNGNVADFRLRMRSVDVMVLDDIHELSRQETSQEEFFHTFNALYQSGKQIVVSSDARPDEIPHLEERLTSRFNCGLVTTIAKPCYETRVAIVKSKAALRNMAMPDDVAEYIAQKFDSNIRVLEGAITTIRSVSSFSGEPITIDLARTALGEPLAPAEPSVPTIHSILDVITGFYGIRLPDLLSRKRQKSLALPRQVGMWLARKYTRYSLGEIGGYFGGRDHTTVLHATRTIEIKLRSNPAFKAEVGRVEERVSAAMPEGLAVPVDAA